MHASPSEGGNLSGEIFKLPKAGRDWHLLLVKWLKQGGALYFPQDGQEISIADDRRIC